MRARDRRCTRSGRQRRTAGSRGSYGPLRPYRSPRSTTRANSKLHGIDIRATSADPGIRSCTCKSIGCDNGRICRKRCERANIAAAEAAILILDPKTAMAIPIANKCAEEERSVPQVVDVAVQPTTGGDTDETERRHEEGRDEQHEPPPRSGSLRAGEQDPGHHEQRQDEIEDELDSERPGRADAGVRARTAVVLNQEAFLASSQRIGDGPVVVTPCS